MHYLRKFFFRYILRALLWLRYRVTLIGAEKLDGLEGPVLVCPNHPAFIDPVMVMSYIGGRIPLRPLVTQSMYRKAGLYPIMRFVGALEVPELLQQSRKAREQVQTVITEVVEGLDDGGIFLIYPSGRLERRGFEILGGTRAVHDILTKRPTTTLVLIRTVGLWGSMSSFAPTGQDPNMEQCFIRSLWTLLINGLVFTPRRPVTMTVEIADPSRLIPLDRDQFNRSLEEWYNRELSPTPAFVPYHALWGPRHYDFPSFAEKSEVKWQKVSQRTRNEVGALLEEKLKRPLSDQERKPETLLESLGLDSLDRMDLALSLEQRFGFRSEEIATTLGELWVRAEGMAEGASHNGRKPSLVVPPVWLAHREREDEPLSQRDETIPRAFIQQALAHPREAIAADDLSGVVTYERLLVGARLMAGRFRPFPATALGVLLPASVAADTVVMAAMMAGKLPVLLNWTTGPAQVAHAVKTLNIARIITSRKFLDRAGGEIQEALPPEIFFFLEDFRKEVNFWELMATLFHVRFFGSFLLKELPVRAPEDLAVVLFTSGSEKAPKAVPLTHKNILYDAQAGARALHFKRGDILLGFLPPFHSFGLSGNMVLPLTMGLRVVHHADPTDASGLVRKIAAYKPTLLLTTPTFLNYILGAGTPEDLASLRLVVTGAEKCPEAVFERAAQIMPLTLVTEGYGITECSPVVSVNRPENSRRGTIGQPLEGVELKVVHPETHETLPPGQMGVLLVAGPTIFPGYLNYEGASPFHEIDGKSWYNTGDLVSVDSDQFITFAGRFKRFLKAGGEMISLPALEEPLARQLPAGETGPRIAVEGIELPQGRRIVAFTTVELTLTQANQWLVEAGFRGLMRLDEVRRVEKIPLLGTGKIDYKILRGQI